MFTGTIKDDYISGVVVKENKNITTNNTCVLSSEQN